jgi:hypothetical protein
VNHTRPHLPAAYWLTSGMVCLNRISDTHYEPAMLRRISVAAGTGDVAGFAPAVLDDHKAVLIEHLRSELAWPLGVYLSRVSRYIECQGLREHSSEGRRIP